MIFCNLLYLANQNFRYLYKDLVDIELKSKNDDSKELQILQIIEKFVSWIISEEINQKKNNGNFFKVLDADDLIHFKNSLEVKLESLNSCDFNILGLFRNHIYGKTPLYTAIQQAFSTFKMQNNDNQKFLFLISDGKLTDVKKDFDYITKIRKNADTYEIIIISIFLTSKIIPKEEKLYDECQKHFSKGAKDLFLMSSTLT